MSNQKNKNIGKFIVIILGIAIVFFLLLPFLEEDGLSPTKKTTAQKAVPQIFTSNPLSELVHKIYSMFARNHKQPSLLAKNQVTHSSTSEGFPSEKPNDIRNAAQIPQEQKSMQVDATYDSYGEAGIVNEDGEWVLVRQTSPKAAQPGMHDISAADSAYDRFVRQERAAKYTGQPVSGPQIPDSKWARLWKPLQRLFHSDDTSASGLTASAKPSAEMPSRLVASSASPLPQDYNGRGNYYGRSNSNYGNPSLPELNINTQGDDPVLILLNPSDTIRDTAERLIQTAHEQLPPQEAAKAAKNIQANMKEAIAQISQTFKDQLAQDAQDVDYQDFVAQTLLSGCGESSLSPLYRQSGRQETGCYAPDIDPNSDEAAQLASKAQEEGRQELSATVQELLGVPYRSDKPLDMVVLLERTNRGELPTEVLSQIADTETGEMDIQQDALRAFYEYMSQKQGCDKQDCFWIASAIQRGDPSLKQTVVSSGLNFDGDPLSVMQPIYKEFFDKKIQSDDERDVQQAMALQSAPVLPYYIPYTKQNMDDLNKRNSTPGHTADGQATKPDKPFLIFVPSAANAKDMEEVLPYTSLVIYDDKNSSILDQDTPQTPIQRGEKIRGLVIQRMRYGAHVTKEALSQMTQSAGTDLLQRATSRVQQQLQQTSGQNADEIMGLSSK